MGDSDCPVHPWDQGPTVWVVGGVASIPCRPQVGPVSNALDAQDLMAMVDVTFRHLNPKAVR